MEAQLTRPREAIRSPGPAPSQPTDLLAMIASENRERESAQQEPQRAAPLRTRIRDRFLRGLLVPRELIDQPLAKIDFRKARGPNGKITENMRKYLEDLGSECDYQIEPHVMNEIVGHCAESKNGGLLDEDTVEKSLSQQTAIAFGKKLGKDAEQITLRAEASPHFSPNAANAPSGAKFGILVATLENSAF